MYKNILKIVLPIFLFLFFIPPTLAKEDVNIYFFYGDGCPHCASEERFFEKITNDGWLEENNAKIVSYEVWNDSDNRKLLNKLGRANGWDIKGVPVTVIGNKQFSGWLDEETTGEQIKNAVLQCSAVPCPDAVEDLLGSKKTEASQETQPALEKINFPIIGEINVGQTSLPVLTVLIAGLDGFNPCSLWVLLFLISLLVGIENKKKLLFLGSSFILASAIFYFLILSAWLNFLLFIGFVSWIRILIGLVAIYAGYHYVKEYWKNESTCEVVDETKRKRIFDKVRVIINEKKLWLAFLGVVALAVSVNFFELVCSAGLPAVYTQLLSVADLSPWQYYAYLLFYVFIFVLNQIIILGVALWTLKMKAINPKFIRWVGLVGGSIMFIIGALLLFKPTWLMFG